MTDRLGRDLNQLILRVALKDRRAFDRLYGLASGRVFAVAFRLMKNQAEAEEVCQDAFVRIWERAETFRVGEAHALAWITTIARNLAIDRLRRSSLPTVPVEMANQVPDAKPTPEHDVAMLQTKMQIELCLDELDGTHADAVRSAYIEGYSYRDLAKRYGTPINTVRTWLRRSLMRLRRCMEQATQ